MAVFLPILFSATHSYPPVSSCWKLGISSTAFEYFILTLLGKGTPLALFQVISGTGLEEKQSGKLSGKSWFTFLWTYKIVVQVAGVCNNPAIKCLIELKPCISFADEWFRVKSILQQHKKLSHVVLSPIMAWRCTLRNIIATVSLLYRNPQAPRLEWKTAEDWKHASRNPAYFPRAKHSSVTVDPFAAGTLSGKLTSIFGSYSPITPMKSKHKNLLSPPLFMTYKQYGLHYGPNNCSVKLTEEK